MSDSTGLAVGDGAPSFTAPLVDPDGTTEDVPFPDLYGDQPVLLCFYTNDFSPDCIDEWCSFRDYQWFTTTERLQVVGCSKSRPFTHRKFIDYLDLGFPLYSDTDLEISDAFGVTYRAFNVAARSRRSCFLIDTDGAVRFKWIGEHPLDPTRDTPDVADIHETVAELVNGDPPETFGFE